MGSNCDKTYVEWNSSPGWSLGGGTILYNGTGTSISHSGLAPHTTYYYQAWGWNETYELHSNGYATDYDTTWDTTPSFDNPSPGNTSTVNGLLLNWKIYIFDHDGDTFNWSIMCSNNQNASAIGASNGTKSLSISGLSYYNWYIVWVNATNDFGTTRAWFKFYTKPSSGGGGGGGGLPPPSDYPPLISSITRIPTKVTSENNVTISAIVTDDTGIYSVFLYWNDGSQHSKEMKFQGDNKYSTVIGPFTELITITYWINATDTASQATESKSYSFIVSDISGPSITVIKPISGAIIYDTTPTIKVSLSDPSGIDITSVILSIDDIKTTPQDSTSSSVTYTPSIDLTFTTHTIKLNVSDLLGNSQIKEWSFTIKETEFINEENIENISSGEEKEIKLNNSNETGIDSINLKVAINLTNIKIFIAKLKDKPEQIDNIPTNTTSYCYLQIEITANDTNIDDDSFNSLNIKFKIKNDWLKNQNINKFNIKLVKYKNGSWIIPETNYLTEDNTYTYYETSMSGFSTIAIIGTKIATGKITPASEFNYIFIVIAAILIIVLIVSILFKTGILYIEEEITEEDS
jgi:PGF-pre-PGF domain-containing protein